MKTKKKRVNATQIDTDKYLIKPNKVALGHQAHANGCGVHDSRPKRLRTRSSVKRAALKESE